MTTPVLTIVLRSNGLNYTGEIISPEDGGERIDLADPTYTAPTAFGALYGLVKKIEVAAKGGNPG